MSPVNTDPTELHRNSLRSDELKRTLFQSSFHGIKVGGKILNAVRSVDDNALMAIAQKKVCRS